MAIAAFGTHLKVQLDAKMLELEGGVNVQVDGVYVDADRVILVESWAHVGQARGAQPKKVQADLLKLALIKASPPPEFKGKEVHAYLLFVDKTAMDVVQGQKWAALAASKFEITPKLINLDPAVLQGIKLAQHDQDMTQDG